MKNKEHLPMYGAVIIAITVVAVVAGQNSFFEGYIGRIFLCTESDLFGILVFCTGALFISGNLFSYLLFLIYWIYMSVLMQCTEEKWLKSLYGMKYEEYCRWVNRCIPWFPKKP